MLKLISYLKPYRLQTLIGPVFKLLEAVFELIVPLVMARIIDVGVYTADTGYILRMGGVLVLLGVVGLAASLTCQRCAAIASQGSGTDLRNDLFRHINTLSHREIDALGTPTLITRMTSDVNQLQLAVAMLIRLVIRAPFLAVGSVVLSFAIDVRMALIFLAATVLIALVVLIVMRFTLPRYAVLQKQLDRMAGIVSENLTGARVIRAFSGQEREIARFDEAKEAHTQTALRAGKISALLSPLTYIIVNLAIAAILLFGGGRVNIGSLTQGEVIALINYMLQLLQAMLVVANLFVIFSKASASAARVTEVFAVQTSVCDALEQVYPEARRDTDDKLTFTDVCFSYAGEGTDAGKYVLRNISFTVRPGEIVGVIGATGSGKSTLVSLIPRFYDVTGGSITLDGTDVRQIPLAELRRRIGFVPQRAALISGTVADNLRWGNPRATDDALWAALETAQAADFVRQKPGGLSAPISRGAKNLSGGQKQRLTIARALVGRPEILILDDSASALDYATDAALRRALRRASVSMTQIIVSQRVSSVRHADKILVLDDGALVGVGTHDALLTDCAVYREIYDSQREQ